MLVFYFLKRISYHFLLFFIVLCVIFSVCNVFLRLPFIYRLDTIPALISIMFPLVAQFSIPIASGLGVFTTMTEHTAHDELLIISFLKRGRLALGTAVSIFVVIMVLCYSFLIFQLGPQSYLRGKRFLFDAAKEHILQLEPGRFHSPFPDVTFYFAAKEKSSLFQRLVVMLTTKQTEQFLFCAREGKMVNDAIVLYEGTLCTTKEGHFYLASFHETTIDLGSLIDQSNRKEGLMSVKYATLKNLFSTRLSDQESFVEFHKRIAHVLWLIVLIVIAFWAALFFLKATWLTGLVLCGFIFIISYVLTTFGCILAQGILSAFFAFYLPPLFLLATGYFLLKKK